MWQLGGGGLDALARTGQGVAAGDIDRRRGAVTAATLATIVYTSGTTGRPKGCMISHGNLTEAVSAITGVPGVRERVLTEGSSSLFFLPCRTSWPGWSSCAWYTTAWRTGFLSDPGELPAELAAFRPTILLAVPRVLEKVAAAAREQAEAEGPPAAVRRRAGHGDRLQPGGRPGRALLRLRHAVFGRLVYARLRAGLGGRVAWAVSGGAPLNQELGHFLRGAGITIMEGWGLTETTGGVTMNPPAVQRIGSVGLPLPGCAVRIAPDGEVEVQGPVVFQGYWHDPQATAQVFDGRWLRTGDLGRCDDDGYLYITGRKKDLIITAGGKNVAPEVLEDRLREHWLIEEGVVVGDRRPYIAALVTLDQAAFARWKRRQGKPASATTGDLSQDPDLLAAVRQAVDQANTAVSRAEAIKRFRILPGAFAVGDELTPTQKVRRDHVLAKFATDVEALYS